MSYSSYKFTETGLERFKFAFGLACCHSVVSIALFWILPALSMKGDTGTTLLDLFVVWSIFGSFGYALFCWLRRHQELREWYVDSGVFKFKSNSGTPVEYSLSEIEYVSCRAVGASEMPSYVLGLRDGSEFGICYSTAGPDMEKIFQVLEKSGVEQR